MRIRVLEMGNRKQAYRSNTDHWVILVLCVIFLVSCSFNLLPVSSLVQYASVLLNIVQLCSNIYIRGVLFNLTTFSKLNVGCGRYILALAFLPCPIPNIYIYPYVIRSTKLLYTNIYTHIIAFVRASN